MAEIVSGFSTEGSVESTMRKSDHVKLGQMLLTLSQTYYRKNCILYSEDTELCLCDLVMLHLCDFSA